MASEKEVSSARFISLENLFSLMSRPKIGLALGSGGARGLIHIGVLKVLIEQGIKIDFISGASSGAIVGAYYSLKREVLSFERRLSSMKGKDFLKMIDLTSPKRGLISGRKVMKFIEELLGPKTFSDLEIPLTIVATDMSTGEEKLFTDGLLTDAIRASISLPGIFPPAELGGSYYLDGGLVNPTPVNIVRDMGADVVIAVDLTMSTPKKLESPTMIDTLTRSFEIMRTHTTRLMIEHDASTVVIRSRGPGLFDTYKFYDQSFIREGERLAREALPRIKELIG